MSIIGKGSQRKGADGELELLHLFHDKGFPAYRNNQRYRGGLENPDLCLTAPGGKRYHCEVKRTERLKLYEAMEQAIHDANGKTTPIVLHRKNRREWVAIMRLDDFLSIVGGKNADHRPVSKLSGKQSPPCASE